MIHTENVKKNYKRDTIFDIARCISIVSIVCCSHLLDYIDRAHFPDGISKIFAYMTFMSLVTFSMMSAYFLKKKSINCWNDVFNFYNKRFLRFWILFFVASLTLYIASMVAGRPWYPSVGNFVLSLVGLTGFFTPLPATLWFMVIMTFFYMITPSILAIKSVTARWCVSVLTVMLILLMQKYNDNMVDYRLPLYLSFYFVGLLLPDGITNYIKKHYRWILLICMLYLIFMYKWYSGNSTRLCVSIVGYPFILSLSTLLYRFNFVVSVATKISYSSMCMYFFHRHIYLLFVLLWNMGSLSGLKNATIPLWFGIFVIIPIIMLFSYVIQRTYDFVLSQTGK